MSSLENLGTETKMTNNKDAREAQGFRIEWKVPAKELQSTNKNAVSPLFDLPGHPLVKVKMLLSPPVSCESRGGASFKKSKGRDLKLELKCEEGQEVAGSVNFSLYIAMQPGPAQRQEHGLAQRQEPEAAEKR